MKYFVIVFLLFQFFFAQSYSNEDRYFSPNLDGEKDTIIIPADIKDKNLEKWSMTIFKKVGKNFRRVKDFESVNPKEEKLDFKKFFSRIINKDSSINSPESIIWDGRNESGKQVDDGIYYFSIEASDRSGNKKRSPFFPIVVDIVTPRSEFKLGEDIFSPNQDGKKEKLKIDVNSKNFSSIDKWEISIKDKNNKLVKTITSSKPKTTINWDGLDNASKPVPEGSYSISILSKDLAGNLHRGTKQKFQLVRSYEKINLEISQNSFSPNKDGYFDTVSFENYLSSLNGIKGWKLEIKNKKGKIVKLFKGGNFKKSILYDGYSDKGKVLRDGKYQSQLRAFFRSGNQPNSKKVDFIIDNQSPKISIKLRNKILNPKAIKGGFKDLLVYQKFPQNEINQYQGEIIKENGETILKKSFKNNPPAEFIWNGKNHKQETIPGKYFYIFKARDKVGNTSSVTSEPFKVIDESLNVEVMVKNSSFSPNNDGKLDEIEFSFKVNKQYRDILSKAQLVVFNSSQKKIKKFDFTKFPKKIIWDGFLNKKGSKKPYPDGVYYYSLKASFATKEVINTPQGEIYLDTTPISLKIASQGNIFSPNNDGVLDELIFSNIYNKSKLKPEDDKFNVLISKVDGKRKGVVYKQKKWKGRIPNQIIWNGKDQFNQDIPEGNYRYEIVTVDHAQNTKIYFKQPIKLVKKSEKFSLILNKRLVSSSKKILKNPKVSPQVNQLGIKPVLSSTEGLKKIDYYISKKNERKLTFFKKNNPNSFNWLLPKGILNQKSSQDILKSGNYKIFAEAVFDSGNHPISSNQTIFIDNDKPVVKAISRPLFFSPDNDGINEKLDIRIFAEDNHKLKHMQAYIFREEVGSDKGSPAANLIYHQKQQIPLKTWTWKTDKKNFDLIYKWNGKGDLGDLVESATDYKLFVKAEDKIGWISVNEHSFLVDILVRKLADGRLKIILQSINFKYDSDKMIGGYEKVIGLLIRMLNKFADYKIEIVGHTDSRGSDKYNQKLSLKRAQRVAKYLVKKRINKDRLSSQGRGENELLIKEEEKVNSQFNSTMRKKIIENNYRKNRRVEFFLNKPKSSPK